MRAFRHLGLLAPVVLVACATAVTEDLSDDEGSGADAGTGGLVSAGGKVAGTGGKSGSASTSGGAGSGPKAFGGSATSGGNDGEAGETSGGSGGSSSGSGGQATAGSAGTPSGGSSGAAGAAGGGSGGSAGSPVGTGSCSSTPLFAMGPSTKYAKDAKVVDVCSGGTPCTQAQPALENGKSYEFSCLDEYNCGVVDPGTTNWAIPPWAVSKACE